MNKDKNDFPRFYKISMYSVAQDRWINHVRKVNNQGQVMSMYEYINELQSKGWRVKSKRA